MPSLNRISAGDTAQTAKEVWDALKFIYEKRTRMTTVKLMMKFRNKQCKEGNNVRIHFEELSNLRD